MVSANQAIANARTFTRYAVGRCDEFVAEIYGYGSSGYSTAVTNWQATPSGLRHPGDWNAPAGALMYWSGGSTGAGHVALSLGNGLIISTDATGPGTVGQIPARTPTDKWGHPYLGWAFPFFQGKEATSSLGPWSGATSVADTTNAQPVSADSVTAGFFTGVAPVFKGFMSAIVWFGEIGIAIALMVIGTLILVKGFRET